MKTEMINNFIDSLENNSLSDEQNSFVLQSELSSIGGDNLTCKNSSASGCNGKNTQCTNIGESCNGAGSNVGCSNESEGEEEQSNSSPYVCAH